LFPCHRLRPSLTPFPCTTLFRSPNPDVTVDVVAFQWNWEFRYQGEETPDGEVVRTTGSSSEIPLLVVPTDRRIQFNLRSTDVIRSEEHTSELQSRENLVCRLLLE